MSIWATPSPADDLDTTNNNGARQCGGCHGNGGFAGQWSGWVTCPDCGGTGTEAGK